MGRRPISNTGQKQNMDGIDREFTYFQEIIPAKKKSEKGGGVVSIHQVLVVEM
jgi:hypothetical protein